MSYPAILSEQFFLPLQERIRVRLTMSGYRNPNVQIALQVKATLKVYIQKSLNSRTLCNFPFCLSLYTSYDFFYIPSFC